MNRALQTMAEERVVALATIFLKRREDFQIYHPGPDDLGIDLVVHVQDKQHLSGRVFGVVLKYTVLPRDLKKDGFDINIRQVNMSSTIPVLLLVFTMQSNEGYYTWLYEPQVVAGQAKLQHITTTNTESLRLRGFHELDLRGLERIATAVNTWYDARLVAMS